MTKSEKMKKIRAEKAEAFNLMCLKAKSELKNPSLSFGSAIGHMGPIKSFGELSESILKLRENFDAMLGKN